MEFKTKQDAINYIDKRTKLQPNLVVVQFEKIKGLWVVGFNVWN